MATLQDIRDLVRSDIRDSGGDVFTDAELTALINQGLDAVSDVCPLEATEVLTITAGTYTYAPSVEFSRIFRVDQHDSSSVYKRKVPQGTGDRTTGWDYFAGILYLQPQFALTTGDKYHVYGDGRYAQLAVDGSNTDASTSVINAVRVFCEVQAFARLVHDRAAFQQWQASPGNSDVSEMELEQMRRGAFARWNDERQRLRKPRRIE